MCSQIKDVRKKTFSQTSMVSVEGLAKLVDPSQLTDDFEGSLDYNHEEWMDLRVSLEEFMSNAVHLLSRLEDLQVSRRTGVCWCVGPDVEQLLRTFRIFQEVLSKKDFPADVEGSRRLIEEHTQLKKKVGAAVCVSYLLKSSYLHHSPPSPTSIICRC